MADGGGDDVFVVLEVVAFFRNLAESAREVAATLGFSAMMRVLAMKGCQLDPVGAIRNCAPRRRQKKKTYC